MKILLFAGLKESLGESAIDIDAAGRTVGQVKDLLAEKFPDQADLIRRSHFAVVHDYVPDSHVLSDASEEIAIIPPVSGG